MAASIKRIICKALPEIIQSKDATTGELQEERSEIMARVRSKNSRPEMLVRKIVFALGHRYRLHARSLPDAIL